MNPQLPEQKHLRCPRCHSDNTKFCYYNNYNLLQPRHFCKNCRRYWTKGGTLRNVPVGGAIRKTTKRASRSPLSSSTSPTSPAPAPDQPKCESTAILGSGGGSFRSQFGSLLMDGLSPNLGDGSGENCLIRNRTADGFGSNLFTDNQSRNGGENGWSPLSIYTPGSSFP